MGTTGTISVMFTDIVGSTSLMESAGAQAWDEHRRAHFNVVRDALAIHRGTEVKNTGDGLMAVFGSVINMVECSAAIQLAVHGVRLGGGPIDVRIGGSVGEAINEAEDWFGTPVVEAARLCALAQAGETLVTGIVRTLAGSADVTFEALGPVTLKGFEHSVDIARVTRGDLFKSTVYADVDRLAVHRNYVVRSLDYWESLGGIRDMRSSVAEQMRLQPGHSFCDIGCGTGTELVRLAAIVGPSGRAVGVDPSLTLLDEARERAAGAGVAVGLHAIDGRATGFDDRTFDAVRMERVVQHVGELDRFVAEALRIVKPGGRVAFADTDWGSLMIHPGDIDLVKRLKSVIENGPWADPWAGRKLHAGMQAGGFTDVTSTAFLVRAEPGLTKAVVGMTTRITADGVTTEPEMSAYSEQLEQAIVDGTGMWAFVTFVASGTRPND